MVRRHPVCPGHPRGGKSHATGGAAGPPERPGRRRRGMRGWRVTATSPRGSLGGLRHMSHLRHMWRTGTLRLVHVPACAPGGPVRSKPRQNFRYAGWIMNLTVVVYVGSTHPQDRIVAG